MKIDVTYNDKGAPRHEPLDLPADFVLEVEESSPIFNDEGTMSVPVSVPATPRNITLLRIPDRIDSGLDPNNPAIEAQIHTGAGVRTGIVNITEAGAEEGITFNVGLDNATAYAKWQSKKLAELSNLPIWQEVPGQPSRRPNEWLLPRLEQLFVDPAVRPDLTIFETVQLNRRDPYETQYVLTEDGERTTYNVPEGYGWAPFLRAWRVVELIFDDLNLVITDNPMKTDPDLARLVVLHNCADAACIGEIRYIDLMPDCTVQDFLAALWCKFGLVYDIDYTSGTVHLALLRDIINSGATKDISRLLSTPPKITYNNRQYVKMTAQTSIEGASPAVDRFEDFIRGLNLNEIHMGANVNEWLYRPHAGRDETEWEGDVGNWDWDNDNDDYEQPDPDPDDPWDDRDEDYYDGRFDDRDDDRDNDRDDDREAPTSYAAARALSQSTWSAPDHTFLAREFVSGRWFKLDIENAKILVKSSPFWQWNPAPEGYEPFELAAPDECVPMGKITGGAWRPDFAVGARHYHSYIKKSDADNAGETGVEDDADETPLAFLFAYNIYKFTPGGGSYITTIGANSCEGDDGKPYRLVDGSLPKVTLLMQFRDGLFANFWRDFDEILRHGNRSVTASANLKLPDLAGINLLKVHTINGVRCLIDRANYILPATNPVNVDLSLRTIQTQGKYDIAKEQNIPDFSVAYRHLAWVLESETWGTGLDTPSLRWAAIEAYMAKYGYTAPSPDWALRREGCIVARTARIGSTWQWDQYCGYIPAPVNIRSHMQRTYRALITYDIYEVGYYTEGSYDLSDEPIGQISVETTYNVLLKAAWVND